MKEATGELNATVVVMSAIAVLIAFFYYTLWPVLRVNFEKNSQCSKAICEPCEPDSNGKKTCKFVTCYPKGQNHTAENGFQCVYKG